MRFIVSDKANASMMPVWFPAYSGSVDLMLTQHIAMRYNLIFMAHSMFKLADDILAAILEYIYIYISHIIVLYHFGIVKIE